MNMTIKNRNAERRAVSVGVFPVTEADILASGNAVVANLPKNSLVINTRVIVTTASGTASASITVAVGSTNIAANVAVTSAAVVSNTTAQHFPSGGAITIKPGTTAPATGSLVATVVVEYIELDKVNGEYTAITNQ